VKAKKTVHLVGIGGAGMSALARIMLERGESVSGSDVKESHITENLRHKNAAIYIGHKKSNVLNAKLLVVSSAIRKNNPELIEAKKRKIPVISRAVMLASLMKGTKNIVIAGSHGKTTTTSMISILLESNGFDPTLAIGGELKVFGGNAKQGKGEYFVAEADESDGSFLKLMPDIAVVTNVEAEHLDFYKDIFDIRKAFKKFINNTSAKGTVVLCIDDPNIEKILQEGINKKLEVITYGIKNPIARVSARKIRLNSWSSSADILKDGKKIGNLKLNIPGIHNMLNATAAVAVGLKLGIEFKDIAKSFAVFRNVRRRFEVKGEIRNILVIDDYAHHPSEIAVTLKAAKGLKRKRIVTIFQPHRFSRTKFLCNEIAEALAMSDVVLLRKIYAAGEKPINGVDTQLVIKALRPLNANVKYIDDPKEILYYLSKELKAGDVLLTMGAGDGYKIGEDFLRNAK